MCTYILRSLESTGINGRQFITALSRCDDMVQPAEVEVKIYVSRLSRLSPIWFGILRVA